jgi:hypothetical protein
VKKFKRDNSDEDDEDEEKHDKKIITVEQKVNECIERYSLQPCNGTDTVPETFVYSDFDIDDCTAADFQPQDLVAPNSPVFDYTKQHH